MPGQLFKLKDYPWKKDHLSAPEVAFKDGREGAGGGDGNGRERKDTVGVSREEVGVLQVRLYCYTLASERFISIAKMIV